MIRFNEMSLDRMKIVKQFTQVIKLHLTDERREVLSRRKLVCLKQNAKDWGDL